MNDQEELEQWRLIHILHGSAKPEHCWHRCHDDLCIRGCLNQKASFFRPEIMHGVEILRKQSDPRFPVMVPKIRMSGEDSCITSYCHDPVCQVVGCMEAPAYNFRELIKVAREEELLRVLKK